MSLGPSAKATRTLATASLTQAAPASRGHAEFELVHAAIERLGRLADLFVLRRAQLALLVGLSEQQWHVLEEISTEHFMPSMFARRMESSPAYVSKVLRQLLDQRVVRVSVSTDDGRQRRYELTPSGKRVLGRLREQRRRAIAAIWSDLPEKELESFLALSDRLISRIERYAQRENTAQHQDTAKRQSRAQPQSAQRQNSAQREQNLDPFRRGAASLE